MGTYKALFAASLATGLFLDTSPALADGARDWQNLPVDTNILFAYYTYSNTEATVDLSLPVEGVSVDAHVPILRYARTFGIAGKIAGTAHRSLRVCQCPPRWHQVAHFQTRPRRRWRDLPDEYRGSSCAYQA